MKKVASHIFIVLLAVILLDKVFSSLFMTFIFSNTFSGESGGTINYVLEKKKELDFIVLGASRAKHGIDPKLLLSLGKNGHNLGINGTNMINHLLVLDILLKNEVKMDTIVLQTDLYTYNPSNDKEEVILDQIKRLYPYDTELVRSYVKERGVVEQVLYFFDTYKLNRKVANIGFNFLKKDSISETDGFVGLPITQYPPDNKPLFPEYIYSSTSTNSTALGKIQELADANGIQLILIFGPSYENVMYNKKEQGRLIADLKARGFRNIIDLSDIEKIPQLKKPEYWRDGTHLSDKGAEVFSKIVNTEISKLKI